MSERDDLAEDRTNLAEDRTVLANERTFAGWVRTGLSFVAIGLGFHALFNRMEPPWIPRAISTVFLAAAIAIFLGAERRATAVNRRLESHRVADLRPGRIQFLSATAILASLALIAAIWLLRIEPA